MTIAFRRAVPADFSEVRRITRDAYLRAGHFAADHPYMDVLEDVEHRAEHAQVWVAEIAGQVVAAVTLTFVGQPYREIAEDGELEFRMLAVDPACQGSGVGRAVVPEIARHARSCQTSTRSASPAPRSWNAPKACIGPWASAGPRSGTGMCRARMWCCGCSGLNSTVEPVETTLVETWWLTLSKPRLSKPGG